MSYFIFSQKEIEKWDKELIELHKRVITNWLIARDIKLRTRKKFFIIYDQNISPKNIRQYFNRPIHIFIRALVRDELNRISDYNPREDGKRKTRKKRTKKN